MSNTLQVHNSRISLAICTPIPAIESPPGSGNFILDTISPLWQRARAGLSHPTNINMVEFIVDKMEVGDARNKAAAQALRHQPDATEFLFFLDYDVLVPFDALTRLFFRARCFPDYDVFAGVYCCKGQNPPDPLIYRGNGQGAFLDWAVGDILTSDQHGITSFHMGLTLIRTSLFQRMIDAGLVHGDGTDLDDEPWFLTRWSRKAKDGAVMTRSGTEDIYFLDKARECGAKLMVDTGILAGHYDKRNGATYGLPWDEGPTGRAKWMPGRSGVSPDREAADKKGLKVAIDIGAGSMRRNFPGYEVYTTDIRKDAGPDYVQDTRKLNLPDDHFDLVACAHHLEHFGRYEQDRIWSELVRICKPGGEVEFILPNVEWAAGLIVDGGMDERCLDVLYGAQERFEFDRAYNTHFMAYTPLVAKALAEEAGLADVKMRTYKDDPKIHWEIILSARKPLPGEVPAKEVEAKSGTMREKLGLLLNGDTPKLKEGKKCQSNGASITATPQRSRTRTGRRSKRRAGG